MSFRHEIVRMAVAGAIPPLRCVLTHARILGALRDRGCDDDARLAFHAEGAGDGPAVLRSAPAAARRAAGLGSHREAAAQFERALRFSGGLDTAARAGLYDGLAAEAGRWWTAGRMRPAPGSRRSALWRQAGDRRREGASSAHALPHHVAAVPWPGGPRRGRGGRVAARTAGPERRAGLGVREPGQPADG